jgi:tetratricopeptide (TPR) repeat protein
MLAVEDKIENYIAKEDWKNARSLIHRELKKTPEDHWLLTRLSTTYYEERQYKKALTLVEEALKYAPRCPLVLWDYAGTLEMMGSYGEAIKIWKKLIKKGGEKIAHDQCGEGLKWARSLLNDSTYRIGVSYYKMGKLYYAEKYVSAHIENRKLGIRSIYSFTEVRKKLRDILLTGKGK